MKILASKIFPVFATALVAAFAAYVILLRFTNFLIMSRGEKALYLGRLWIILTSLLLLIFTEASINLIKKVSKRSNLKILIISIVFSLIFIPVIYKLPLFPQSINLEITPLEQNTTSPKNGPITVLCIERIDLPSRTATPLTEADLRLDEDWIANQDSLVFTLEPGGQGTIHYENFIQAYVRVEFLIGPDEGEAEIRFNGESRPLNLYSQEPGSIELALSSPNIWANADRVRRVLLAGDLIVAFLLLTISLFLTGLVIYHLLISREIRIRGLWAVFGVIVVSFLLIFLIEGVKREVNFGDPQVEAAVRDVINKPEEPISSHDLLSIIELDLTGRQISSLEGIAALRNLRVLNTSGNRISDFAPLEKLVKLQELDLSRNMISDLASLPNLPKLEQLDLSENQITDIYPLRQFSQLSVLDLSRNQIKDIEPVGCLSHLERLNLRENQVTNISALTALKRLTYLNLHSNSGITDLSPVGHLTRLETLILRNVHVGEQISNFVNLRNLKYLNLRNSSVTNIDVLADLMEAGTLQQHDNSGIESTVNLLENEFPVDGPDPFARLRPYWENVTNRYPYLLPYFPGDVATPVFSQPGGFYEGEFDLILSTTEAGGRIFYTIDGSEPVVDEKMAVSGNTRVYIGPIRIEDRSGEGDRLSRIETSQFWKFTPTGMVFKGNVIRAVVVDNEKGRSEVVTHSYFIDENIKGRYTIPVISITTAPAGFFDEKAGIYVPGDLYENLYANITLNPANYSQHGLDWERPGNLELFTPDGQKLLSQTIGIRIHGDASRAYSQKSLRVYAKGKDTIALDVFTYDFFPALNQRLGDSKVETFEALILRNSGQDWNQTLFKDALSQSLLENTKLDIQGYQPVVVFLNGEYWGIHNIRNYYDASYFRAYYGINEDDLSLVYDAEDPYVKIGEPGDDHFHRLLGIIDGNYRENGYHTVNTLSDTARYAQVADMMDIENFIDYYVSQIYLKNNDLQVYRWRKNTGISDDEMSTPYGHDGKWRWMVYDTDLGFTDQAFNTLAYLTMEDNPSTFLLRSLLENEDFRKSFLNRFADMLNSNFREETVLQRIDDFEAAYSPEIKEQINRWGKPAPNYQTWQENVEDLRVFARERPAYQRFQLVNHFGLSGLANLTIKTNHDAGHVRVNSIDIRQGMMGVDDSANWTGIYFQGVPITVTAIPAEGYRFSHWEGLDPDVENVEMVMITLTGDLTLTAVFVIED